MIITLLLLATQPTSYPRHELLDDDIKSFQAKAYPKELLEHTRVLLGQHHGVEVVADFPCSDLCPNYTTKIVHYDVEPGPHCAAIEGVERPAMVPRGIATNREVFCVPAILGSALIREGD